MKKIILFRHGQTDWNKQGLIQGHIDIPLNEEGKVQAKTLAEKLKVEDIEHIYSSDLQRASQTAHIVAEHVQCSVTHMQEFREMHGGIMQGKTKLEFMMHPLYRYWQSDDEMYDHIGFEGGETKQQVKERAYRGLQAIITTSTYRTIAISSHGIFIQHMIRVLLSDSNVSVEKLDNTEYIVLIKSSNGWQV